MMYAAGSPKIPMLYTPVCSCKYSAICAHSVVVMSYLSHSRREIRVMDSARTGFLHILSIVIHRITF